MVDKIWYNMEELVGGSEERILIETYWNVKSGADPLTVNSLHINRNILECKGQRRSSDSEDDEYINRNILECKVGKDGRKCLTKIHINRNILECKAIC